MVLLVLMKKFLILPLILLMNSCAGYKFKSSESIFSINEVNRLVIPFFKNSTPIHGLSRHFVDSTFFELSKMRDLEIDSVLRGDPDEAVLIGRITSGSRKKDIISSTARKFIGQGTGYTSSIGDRPSFYVNSQNTYNLNFEVLIIKNPIIESKANELTAKPKIIFQRSFPVRFNFSNSLQTGNDVDGRTVVNYTMNKSLEKLAFKKVSKDIAFQLRRSLGR